MNNSQKNKNLNEVISADLDGTLAQSKLPISKGMAEVISQWLETNKFVVISGGKYEQLYLQVTKQLPDESNLKNLFLFPANGSICYAYNGSEWIKKYEELFSSEENNNIIEEIKKVIEQPEISKLIPEKTYGERIESRGGQVTLSILGQNAPQDEKSRYDPDQSKRKLIVKFLLPLLSEFEIKIGGMTSIDITKKGIDKAFAIRKVEEILNVRNTDITYYGDALFEDGNDFAVISTGVECVQVSNPEDTLNKIKLRI